MDWVRRMTITARRPVTRRVSIRGSQWPSLEEEDARFLPPVEESPITADDPPSAMADDPPSETRPATRRHPWDVLPPSTW